MADVKPRLEKLFAAWKPGTVPSKNLRTVALPTSQAVYVIDRPGAEQSVILAGHVAPPKANPDEVAIEAMNAILGGQFTSRVNMNIREDKHWSRRPDALLRRPRPRRSSRSRRCRPTRQSRSRSRRAAGSSADQGD
jgi:zinc protease